ncbi:MAG: HD domain-containing protein [bacterium]|nr:HD domain-containing protein [bacterium]
MASQAAIALTNAQLSKDLVNAFYGFIKSIATAIDQKSPYTGGHISRVVDLTMEIAETVNKVDEGPLKNISFNAFEMEELRIAAWMHDVGKITTPEHVVDKSTRLEMFVDRIELIETRFHLIAQMMITSHCKKMQNPSTENIDSDTFSELLDEKFNAELSAHI